MKIRYSALLPAFLLLLTAAIAEGQPGHSITITSGAAVETKIRLAYHVGNQQYVKDSLTTDNAGAGRFSGGEKLNPGVYMIVLPDNRFFEFLLGDDQHFDVRFDMSNPVESLSFTGSEENSRFVAYQRKWKTLQEEAMKISGRLNGLQQGSPQAAAARKS